MTRRALPLLVLSAAAVAAPASTAHAQAAPQCGVSATSVAADGARGFFSVQDGQVVTSATPGDRLSFAPQSLTGIGGAGGGSIGFSNDFALRGNGALISLYRKTETLPDGTSRILERSEQRVAGGWDATRAIATGGDRYVYRLDGRGLLRHRYSPEGVGGSASLHFRVGAADTVAARGFRSYRTLTTVPSGRTRVKLLVTTTAGALRQVVVDDRRGRVLSDERLATGFRGVRTLRSGWCETGDARPLLTQTRNGDVRLYRLDGDTVTGGDVVARGAGDLF